MAFIWGKLILVLRAFVRSYLPHPLYSPYYVMVKRADGMTYAHGGGNLAQARIAHRALVRVCRENGMLPVLTTGTMTILNGVVEGEHCSVTISIEMIPPFIVGLHGAN